MSDTAAARADELRIDAPHRELLDQVLDKWSLSVLNELCERPCRFNELRRAIPAVTQKSLTATLRRLERNGIVERHVVSDAPGRGRVPDHPAGQDPACADRRPARMGRHSYGADRGGPSGIQRVG